MEGDPKLLRLSFTNTLPQDRSPLFTLPGEIRNLIWEYTITPGSDPTRPFLADSLYRRPDYWGEQKSHVALLCTCKAIYAEAWQFPWTTSELLYYLSNNETRPLSHQYSRWRQKTVLKALDGNQYGIRIKHMRIFAGWQTLEFPSELQGVLYTLYSAPRTITVTIRRADYGNWRANRKLEVPENWVNQCRFRDSVETIRVEFECLEDKIAEVDEITQQALKWQFRRQDGELLSATTRDAQGEMEARWWVNKGASEDLRWSRDIGDKEDGRIWHFVRTVVWRVK
ncbi:hypothetical protein TWF730_000078 [Orbilia blumenaviensis]|uniref:Uncharacterized protein n=1 Tax=Orbilia blumenaviensis TaxID=1796055 RepID=A0AAV9VKT1_9PEZI